ncbi:hypothetical protein [Aromatoleum petrolei]|uniref:Uncharacterized protein n=1 Tax=Aromatoleum petrolei TaxID=76116 RepID=A0ABX1N0R6_9RHOO|nr:hypothetical protein [Aromatoleum petrolei]NMF91152.1 hypothetical protein [Aromatoleum petrolei]QTQ37614.1 Uncharacterized protein ToN1_34980 [Aromatoleum petrolei]
MSKPNLKLSVSFEFELEAPAAFVEASHEKLCKAVQELLGAMVLQGMPTVTAKQLAKAGVAVVSHHHHLDVLNTAAASVPRAELVAAGPHLTDDELDQLARRSAGRVPLADAERGRFLRRHALALAGEFRMVPCVVGGRLSSGKDAALAARLNLTNGSVLVSEQDRQSRLQANQDGLVVAIQGSEVRLRGACAGHTLSGPVIEVALGELAAHRDALVAIWQKGG